MLIHRIVDVGNRVVFPLEQWADDYERADWDRGSIYSNAQSWVGRRRNRIVLENIPHRWIGREALHCRQAIGGWGIEESGVTSAVQVSVFIVAKEEHLVLKNRSTDICAETIVVIGGLARNRMGGNRLFRQVIHGVEIAVLEIFVSGTVEVIRSSFSNQIELAPGRVSRLSGELIGLQGKLGYGIGDHGGIRARHAEVVVIHAIHVEVILTRTCAAYRPADSCDASWLRHDVRS